jgi:hypothetical protein
MTPPASSGKLYVAACVPTPAIVSMATIVSVTPSKPQSVPPMNAPVKR